MLKFVGYGQERKLRIFMSYTQAGDMQWTMKQKIERKKIESQRLLITLFRKGIIMSKKTLRMNSFGESILSEFDLFHIWVSDIHRAYPETANKPDIYKVKFNWDWNGYNGYGEIDYYSSTKTVCNVFGENLSNMTVHPNSKRQQLNGRSNCALYNDKSLEELFSRILNMIDLSKAK